MHKFVEAHGSLACKVGSGGGRRGDSRSEVWPQAKPQSFRAQASKVLTSNRKSENCITPSQKLQPLELDSVIGPVHKGEVNLWTANIFNICCRGTVCYTAGDESVCNISRRKGLHNSLRVRTGNAMFACSCNLHASDADQCERRV